MALSLPTIGIAKTMTVKRLKPKLNGGPRVKLMLYKLSDTHHKREMEGKKREKKKEWYATRARVECG